MADSYNVKKITELAAKSASDDTDLYVVGNQGTATMRKISFATIAAAVRDKLTSLTFPSLNTSNKTLPGAVNELNSNKELVLSGGLKNGSIDSLRSNGFYWMQKANTTGTQPGYDYYLLTVFAAGYAGAALQIAYAMSAPLNHKMRMYVNGSWSNWA